jgi:hypothetical protein
MCQPPIASVQVSRTSRSWGLLLTFVSLACASRESTPELAYRDFARAVSERDGDRAWELLSSDTQAWLEARAKAAATTAPGVVPPSGRQLLLGDASLAPRPLASVLVLRESRDRALVQAAEEGGPKHEVELVREGTWRVRVPEIRAGTP